MFNQSIETDSYVAFNESAAFNFYICTSLKFSFVMYFDT